MQPLRHTGVGFMQIFDHFGHFNQRRQLRAVAPMIVRFDMAGQFGGIMDLGAAGHRGVLSLARGEGRYAQSLVVEAGPFRDVARHPWPGRGDLRGWVSLRHRTHAIS